jgi:hypothetical protein
MKEVIEMFKKQHKDKTKYVDENNREIKPGEVINLPSPQSVIIFTTENFRFLKQGDKFIAQKRTKNSLGEWYYYDIDLDYSSSNYYRIQVEGTQIFEVLRELSKGRT